MRGRPTGAHSVSALSSSHESELSRVDHRLSDESNRHGRATEHAFKRHSFNNVERPSASDNPERGPKRPLSPAASGRQGRSISPPSKRRSVAEATWKRSPVLMPRQSVSPADAGVWGDDARHGGGVPAVDLSGTGEAAEGSASVPSDTRHAQAHALNRELWDVRRQIAVLKAREEGIMNELKDVRAPEFAALQRPPSAEQCLKGMEAEIICTCLSVLFRAFVTGKGRLRTMR